MVRDWTEVEVRRLEAEIADSRRRARIVRITLACFGIAFLAVALACLVVRGLEAIK